MFKTYFNWSTGKDSALALYYLLQNPHYDVDQLVTTINSFHDRVTMHGLRRELLVKQLKAINLPYSSVELPEQPSMEKYNQIMQKKISELQNESYTHTGFGDIFLEDLRKYQEQQHQNIICLFPLWHKNTKTLFSEFINLGFKSKVICVNGDYLDKSFLGRDLDKDFLKALPENVDPCGENGEFHTFCYDGPIFSNAIDFEIGERKMRQYNKPNSSTNEKIDYWFLDLK